MGFDNPRRWIAPLLALTVLAFTATARAGTRPIGGLGTAVYNLLFSPGAVSGANDWSCKPTAAHPYPVVLVHGTAANMGASWVALSPMLADSGFCVFAVNYGMAPYSAGRIGGLTGIADSARTLRAFVERVLSATGASKVDVVGHSQGGMMPAYYIKRLGGATRVHTLVGLAPSNHGTTLDGLVGLGADLRVLGLANGLLNLAGTQAAADQEAGSPFQSALFADGDTVPGVRYVVIATTHDTVVTPYDRAFLHGGDIENITIQDQCPGDRTGHVGLVMDGPALQNVLNALGPDIPGFRAACTGYGPPG
jgi:triacylglycerol esterase/lipase EstA (alpha/beta hydrolase family)